MWASVVAGVLVALGVAWLLGRKWELPARAVLAAVAGVGVLCAAVVGLLGDAADLAAWLGFVLTLVGTLGAATALGLWRFYRDPERTPPARPDAILSPADGTVVYIRRAERGALPVLTKAGRSFTVQELTRTATQGDHVVIGIALNFLDVHVNRAPTSGDVIEARRHPGRFASLKRPEAIFENERATFVFRRADLELAVVLIASRLVRRITTFVNEGESVEAGQRIGAIRFGSQADVVLPVQSTRVIVAVGDRLRAGETIVAVWAD